MREKALRRIVPLLGIGLALIVAAFVVRSQSGSRTVDLRTRSLPDLEALVRSRPEDTEARYYLGRSYAQQRRFSDAQAAYEAVLDRDPKSARAQVGLAFVHLGRGEAQLARERLEKALALDATLAGAEYTLGKLLWEQGNPAEALPHVRRAAELDPKNHEAWYGLAVCLTQLRRFDEAVPAYQKALAQHEADAKYHAALGELLVYQGKMDEARKHYDRALEVDPNYGPGCALAGGFYLSKVPGPEALAHAEELLVRASQLPTLRPQQVYLDLGQLYIQKGDFKKAVEALQTAIAKDRRDERAYYALANAYRRSGDSAAAAKTEADFKRISALHIRMQSLEARSRHRADDATVRLELARVYRQIGLPNEAAQTYAAYLQLKPDEAKVAREFEGYLKEQAPPGATLAPSQAPPILPGKP